MGGVAVKAKGLLGNLRNAREFIVGGFQKASDAWGCFGIGFGEVDEIGNSFERVIDLVGDAGGKTAGSGQLFAGSERAFLFFALRDVLYRAGEPGYFARGIGKHGSAIRVDPALHAVERIDAVFGAVLAFGAQEIVQIDRRVVKVVRIHNPFAEGIAR